MFEMETSDLKRDRWSCQCLPHMFPPPQSRITSPLWAFNRQGWIQNLLIGKFWAGNSSFEFVKWDMIRAQASFKPGSRNLQESTASAKKSFWSTHFLLSNAHTRQGPHLSIGAIIDNSAVFCRCHLTFYCLQNLIEINWSLVWCGRKWTICGRYRHIDTLRGGQTLRGGVDGQQMLTQRSLRVT